MLGAEVAQPLGPWWVQLLGTGGALGIITFLWLKIGRPGLADADSRAAYWRTFASDVNEEWESRFKGLETRVVSAESRANEAISRADACEERESRLLAYLRTQGLDPPDAPG